MSRGAGPPAGPARHGHVTALLVALLTAACSLAGCGGERGERPSGGRGEIDPRLLSGKSFTVGSKEFTEQVLLGQITVLALRAAGAEVEDETRLAGSATTRRALTSGEIDMYWEYTGTAWITFMDETEPILDELRQYRAVAERDVAENGVVWMPYARFNDTYAIAVRREAAGPLGVRTISDMARVARERPAEATLCVDEEFLSRDDGLPGLQRAYGFLIPDEQILKLDEGLVYNQIDSGTRCNFGEVFSTDGRIAVNDLLVLEDDRRFFPKYNPALTVRAEVFDRSPELRKLFGNIARRLDTKTMQRLNAEVDVSGLTEEEVAEEWLSAEGLVP